MMPPPGGTTLPDLYLYQPAIKIALTAQQPSPPFIAVALPPTDGQTPRAASNPTKAAASTPPKQGPDLAIEVIITSSGIDRLDLYQGLGVREVWFWQAGWAHAICPYICPASAQPSPKNFDLGIAAGEG